MPFKDGTGPCGAGPLGRGQGRRRGMGRGMGLCRRPAGCTEAAGVQRQIVRLEALLTMLKQRVQPNTPNQV